MPYSIDRFWLPRFDGLSGTSVPSSLTGWSGNLSRNEYFVEPTLSLRDDSGDLKAPIWFVAAPGAVGKSTFAKEICARTGSIYLDLAQADSVAGNYITGGLFKAGVIGQWTKNETALLIDALDEARLRVTQRSFEDFISDLATAAKGNGRPIVCFGRVGIIEEAWLMASDRGIECPIFDISFFDKEKASYFVVATLRRLARQPGYDELGHNLETHPSVYKEAADRFVNDIDRASDFADDGFFSGYAPVLEAVATVLGQTSNPAMLQTTAMQEMKKGEVLQILTSRILDREAGKLRDQIQTIPDELKGNLYTPREQLGRLCHTIPGARPYVSESIMHHIPSEHRDVYESAVKSFIEQHPFLNGTGTQPSSAVFGAAIIANALFSNDSINVSAAESFISDGRSKANPFLIDFYLDRLGEKDGAKFVPPERVAALYDSIRARARAGDIAWMSIEGSEDNEDAEVEIQILSGEASVNNRPKVINISTSQAGCLRFSRQVVDVSIFAPHLDIAIGAGNPVEFVAPVYLNVARLRFDCQEVVCLKGEKARNSDDNSVVLEAVELLSSNVTSAPVVRLGAELSVSWKDSNQYLWSTFSVNTSDTDGDIGEKLRLFRRLIMAFRSHSKGRLARFKDKIEHFRMTKGENGIAIREQLIKDKIISLEGNMYFLDPDKLGLKTETSFQDIKTKNYKEQLRSYVGSITLPN